MNYNGAWLRILLVFLLCHRRRTCDKDYCKVFLQKKRIAEDVRVFLNSIVLKTNNNNYLNALHAMI